MPSDYQYSLNVLSVCADWLESVIDLGFIKDVNKYKKNTNAELRSFLESKAVVNTVLSSNKKTFRSQKTFFVKFCTFCRMVKRFSKKSISVVTIDQKCPVKIGKSIHFTQVSSPSPWPWMDQAR